MSSEQDSKGVKEKHGDGVGYFSLPECVDLAWALKMYAKSTCSAVAQNPVLLRKGVSQYVSILSLCGLFQVRQIALTLP